MIDVNFIRANGKEAVSRLKMRTPDAESLINEVLKADDQRKKFQQDRDNVLSEAKKISEQVGDLFKEGKKEEAEGLKNESKNLKEKANGLEKQLNASKASLIELLSNIPNLPHESVPIGTNSDQNETIFTVDQLPDLGDTALAHWDLGIKYDIIDLEAGVKITGAGFPLYKGSGAKLQRALINFFLDEATKAGYQEVQPPLMVNEASAFATGQLPDKEEQMYVTTLDNFYLIPTAEVPITNIYRDEILREDEFPIKLTAYTPCFRREAGSYGKDVKGLNRIHQFDKVEIVQLQHPKNSYDTLEDMKDYVEGLLKKLELPYRILKLCTGDLGFTSSMTYDMEVYSAAQKRWLEVSSISNFESFQANRLKLRFKDKESQKTRLVHTLNGSALALPRIFAALLENNQQEDHITIPAVLVDYTGFKKITIKSK